MKIFTALISALVLTVTVYPQNLLNGPDDIVFDAKYNRYLVGNWAGNRIVAVDSNGNQTVFKTGLLYCHGMELLGDTLYAASADRIYCIDINNTQTIKNITVPGSSRLGHITLDTINNNLYVSDWNIKKIFKVNLCANTSTVLVNSGIETPVGVHFDGIRGRLILLTFDTNTPVKAVNINSGQITNITSAGYDHLDAIAKDKYGYIYASSFTLGTVYRFDSIFSAQPEIISTGHNGPSGFGYSPGKHILGVTNYNSNSYSLISLPVVSVKNIPAIIESFTLLQNYPNPFNPVTKIQYSLPERDLVTLTVYNMLGNEIKVLVSSWVNAGTYNVDFDASNLPSGIYFYRLSTDKYSSTKKMCLLK